MCLCAGPHAAIPSRAPCPDRLRRLYSHIIASHNAQLFTHTHLANTQASPPAPQVISQCLTFILAGFDTTSNGLAFAAYLLAAHPEVARWARSGQLRVY